MIAWIEFAVACAFILAMFACLFADASEWTRGRNRIELIEEYTAPLDWWDTLHDIQDLPETDEVAA